MARPLRRGFRSTRQLAIVVAVVAVSMLGNLRSQASESSVRTGRTSMTTVAAAANTATVSRAGTIFELVGLAQAAGLDADAPSDESAALPNAANDDGGEFVPAIYAWDPDVRFVYYRHVSKWM